MNNAKHTRRALLSSVVALVLCLTMLMGTTFAWFTDTATVKVNTIQSGTLDIDLVDVNGETLVGKEALSFKKAADAPADEEILWEPGCTYELEDVFVVNKGNLDLKFKIVISGIQGSAKLNEAIEWTVKYNGNEFVADEWIELEVTENEVKVPITISGHMKEDAGNEYQGLTIDGVAITVNATQLDSEWDSTTNEYDKNAPQLVSLNGEEYVTLEKAIVAAASGDTIYVQGEHTFAGVANKSLTVSGIDNAALITIANGSYSNGSTLNFENLFIQGYDKEDTFYTTQLAHATKATYKNCTVSGLITTYCDSEFVGCNFNNTFVDQYSVFCYGGNTVITDCTFNTPCSKAVKLYNEGTGEMTLTVSNCDFTTFTVDKAAIEIDSTYTTNYTVNITDCTINGAYKLLVNDKSTKSTITVDGKTVELVKANNQEELNNAIANNANAIVTLPAGTYTLPAMTGKDVTISGDEDTVINLSNPVTASGSTVTMNGVTVNVEGDGTYKGIQHAEKVVYNNATFNGTQFLYSDAEFTNCTFNVTGDKYNIWVYGNNATFTNWTFNCDGKAVLQYNEGAVTATATFNNCKFIDNNGVTEDDGSNLKKAAIEIGESAYGNMANYTVNINNCTVNGFDVTEQNANTFGGSDLGTNVWGNKNLMPAARLNVFVDSTEVY